MADRVEWPPSLSHDRKWPRLIKCTRSRVVGFRLEGNLVTLSGIQGAKCQGKFPDPAAVDNNQHAQTVYLCFIQPGKEVLVRWGTVAMVTFVQGGAYGPEFGWTPRWLIGSTFNFVKMQQGSS